MHQVVVHPQARDAIARNADWWAEHHSVDQALTWVNSVEQQLQELAEFPERFGLAAENELFPYEIRQVLVGLGNRRSYRALYTIDENVVHVLTVLRASQGEIQSDDLPSSFNK